MARKARNGAGSSYEYKNRPKGSKTRWKHSRRVTLPDGTKDRIFGYGATQRDAVLDCNAKVDKAMDRASNSQTFGNFLEYYLELKEAQVQAGIIKIATFTVRRIAVEKYMQGSLLSTIPLNMLQPFHIQDWYTELTKTTKTTIANNSYRHLKVILNAARDLGKIDKLPLPRGLKTAEVKPKIALWTPEECRRFLGVAKKHPLYPLFYLAIATGMRRGELLGLCWSCVDFDEGLVSVKYSLKQVRKSERDLAKNAKAMVHLCDNFYLTAPKTKGSLRSILVADDAMQLLREYKNNQTPLEECRYKFDLVFRKANGEPINPETLLSQYSRMQREAEVPKLRFHGLRDMHASYLFAQGRSAASISQRLGHTNITMTLSRYVSSTQPEREKAAMPVEDMLDF